MPNFTPAQRAYIRKKSKPHELDIAEMDDELNIVPFLDIVVNLIMFLLMTISSAAFYTQLNASLPSYGRGGTPRGEADDTPPLNLKVVLTSEGIMVVGSSGKLSPGCEDVVGTGRVFAVPMGSNGQYQWNELRTCAEKVHEHFPDEHQVTIEADPQVELLHVIAAMDAMRGPTDDDGRGTLFPDVQLSAGSR